MSAQVHIRLRGQNAWYVLRPMTLEEAHRSANHWNHLGWTAYVQWVMP